MLLFPLIRSGPAESAFSTGWHHFCEVSCLTSHVSACVFVSSCCVHFSCKRRRNKSQIQAAVEECRAESGASPVELMSRFICFFFCFCHVQPRTGDPAITGNPL
jgi:hypothetical protein